MRATVVELVFGAKQRGRLNIRGCLRVGLDGKGLAHRDHVGIRRVTQCMADAASNKERVALQKAERLLIAGQPQPALAPEHDMDGGAAHRVDGNAPRALQQRPGKGCAA